jgi:hypothetical protein
VEEANADAGLMVTTLEDTETSPLPTAIVATVALVEVLIIVILPLPTATASLNVRTILAVSETPVALSAGTEDVKVGSTVSRLVKLSAVLLLIPAYELLEVSSKAVLGMIT